MEQPFFNYGTKAAQQGRCSGKIGGVCGTDDIIEPLYQPWTAYLWTYYLWKRNPYLFKPLFSDFYYMQPDIVPKGYICTLKVNSCNNFMNSPPPPTDLLLILPHVSKSHHSHPVAHGQGLKSWKIIDTLSSCAWNPGPTGRVPKDKAERIGRNDILKGMTSIY